MLSFALRDVSLSHLMVLWTFAASKGWSTARSSKCVMRCNMGILDMLLT